jgi:hypothetical protein
MAVPIDPTTLTLILKLLFQWGPGIIDALTKLFGAGDGDELDADIAAILAMKSTEELEADVAAGWLPPEWASRLKWLATLKGGTDVVMGIIEAQALLIAGSVSDEQMAEARKATAEAELAYERGSDACEAKDFAAYSAALVELGMQAAIVLKVKTAVCPFMNDKED